MTVKETMKHLNIPGGKQTVLLESILTDDFISKFTDCPDADELFSCCKADFSNQEEFDNLEISYLDNMIKEHSDTFKDFASFIEAAITYRNLQ